MAVDEVVREDDSCSETGTEGLGSSLGANVVRAGKKHQHLRDMFRLPPDEQFADGFHCALKDKILIQGRLYIFEHYICFHANIFGIVTNHAIAVQTISKIQTATHVYLPNSIEVTVDTGKRYFFTSFLSRDEAFELMKQSWTRSQASALRAAANGLTDDDSIVTVFRNLPEDGDIGSLPTPEEETIDPHGDFTWPVVNTDPPECSTSGKNAWTLIAQTAIANASVQDFSNLFKASSQLQNDWHNLMEDTGVQYSPWIIRPNMGKIRDVTFTAKVRGAGPMAPPTADCHQTHRGCLHQQGSAYVLVIQIQQTMPSIPFGEYFKVNACWKITSKKGTLTDPGITVKVFMVVEFIKSTLLANQISSATIKQSKASYSIFIRLLREQLSPKGIASAQERENPLEAALKALLPRIPTSTRHLAPDVLQMCL